MPPGGRITGSPGQRQGSPSNGVLLNPNPAWPYWVRGQSGYDAGVIGAFLTVTADDTLGTTDAADGVRVVSRTANDTLGTTDSTATRIVVVARTAADTLGTSDAAAGGRIVTATASDTLGTTDAASRAALLRPRPAADALGTTDNASRAAL